METRLSPFFSMEQQELQFLLMLHESLMTLGTETAYNIVNPQPEEDEMDFTYEKKFQVVEEYLEDLDIVIKNKFRTISEK